LLGVAAADNQTEELSTGLVAKTPVGGRRSDNAYRFGRWRSQCMPNSTIDLKGRGGNPLRSNDHPFDPSQIGVFYKLLLFCEGSQYDASGLPRDPVRSYGLPGGEILMRRG
jgi:hypothetical protein